MIPDGTESSRKMIAHAWEGRLQHNRLPADLRSFLSEVAAQYNFPFEELLDTEKSIVPFGFKLPEVVLWPYEFDFPRTASRLVGKFYVGSPLDLGRHQNNWDWQEVAGDKPIIYCAMGTRFSDKKVRFLEKLISLFAGLPQYQLIIGAAHYFPLPARLNLPDNVRVVDNAPQITILKKARLMITHCGGNSLKECIIMGVPVLCYPHDNDQFGNAARVQYHRIGLSGDIVADEPDVIKEKIISILHDQGMKEQIQKFRTLFAQYEQSDVATEVVESFLKPVG
jgi:UDP:flavonoid glycosyltransferase YjiC (YdhE family)